MRYQQQNVSGFWDSVVNVGKTIVNTFAMGTAEQDAKVQAELAREKLKQQDANTKMILTAGAFGLGAIALLVFMGAKR